MKRFTMFGLALLTWAALAVAPAPTAKADGWYGASTYTNTNTSARAYWDPTCGCWVYPRYSYYPTYTYRPAYANYGYPRSYSPYYSRPSFSVGFSFGGSRQYGGYGRRRSYR